MALTHGAFGNSIFDPVLLSSNFNPLESLSLLDRMFSPFPRELNTVASTRVDWAETPEAHVLKADLPGMKQEEIEVQIADDGVRRVGGEGSKGEMNEDSYGRVERLYGQFKLPSSVKVRDMSAKVENGVLTVTVPKIEVTKETPKLRDVEIPA